MEHNIDPDHFYLKNVTHQRKYFTEDEFKNNAMTDWSFSTIHFNSRSLCMNISKVQDYLNLYSNNFSAIVISEAWLKEDQKATVQLNE